MKHSVLARIYDARLRGRHMLEPGGSLGFLGRFSGEYLAAEPVTYCFARQYRSVTQQEKHHIALPRWLGTFIVCLLAKLDYVASYSAPNHQHATKQYAMGF